MRIRTILAALLFTGIFLSFNYPASSGNYAENAFRVYTGCFSDGNVVVTIDYNPGTSSVIGISVQDALYPSTYYTVTSYVDNSRIALVSGELVCSNFEVFYSVGTGSTFTYYTGTLSDDCF